MKNRMKKKVQMGMLLAATLLLSACMPHEKKAPVFPTARAAYLYNLKDHGVQVIHVGQTMRVVLQSDFLFNPGSANISASYKPVLSVLAKLIRTYKTVNVKVAAYSDNIGPMKKQQALTTQQAQSVASYLWDHGTNARLAYAVGYNSENAVSSNKTLRGAHENRRVEVSFRYYPRKQSL